MTITFNSRISTLINQSEDTIPGNRIPKIVNSSLEINKNMDVLTLTNTTGAIAVLLLQELMTKYKQTLILNGCSESDIYILNMMLRDTIIRNATSFLTGFQYAVSNTKILQYPIKESRLK